MKNNSALYLHLMVFFVVFVSQIHSQFNYDSTDHNNYYISAGLGVKYNLSLPNYNTQKAYNNNYAFTFGFAADFFGSQKHIIGLEFMGYPWVYRDDGISPRYFSTIVNLYYKRNIHIFKNISIQPSIGFSPYSNDMLQILAPFIKVGVSYKISNYQIFIEHNFRTAILAPDSAPWLIIAGYSIRL